MLAIILAFVIVIAVTSCTSLSSFILTENEQRLLYVGDSEESPTTTGTGDSFTHEGTATEGTATEGTATEGTATEGTATDGTATEEFNFGEIEEQANQLVNEIYGGGDYN